MRKKVAPHEWRHVRWLDGYSLDRCACGVERTVQCEPPAFVRRTVYRREGQAWQAKRLPHIAEAA